MSLAPPRGRRERNKQAKLERIMAAADALFAEHGVDDVTTQQIAEAADIGTGTLFLYAKTKGELLLMVQNAHYAEALERGRAQARAEGDVLEAVMSIISPIVECNRVQVENGRTYLREMAFGDPAEPHHAQALAIVARTEEAVGEVLRRHGGAADAGTDHDAGLGTDNGVNETTVLAHIVSAVMFLSMAAGVDGTTNDVIQDVRRQVDVLLSR